MSNKIPKDEFRCDFCQDEEDTIYEGWFRHSAAFNPFFKGTSDSGLMQRYRVCKICLEKAIKNGQAYATEIQSS